MFNRKAYARPKLPKGARIWTTKPVMMESGYLYFVIEPWHRVRFYWLKVPSCGTMRAVRYWLDRVSKWSWVGCVTHMTEV
jgi:hypothetical protein